jgi:hypothetical protein
VSLLQKSLLQSLEAQQVLQSEGEGLLSESVLLPAKHPEADEAQKPLRCPESFGDDDVNRADDITNGNPPESYHESYRSSDGDNGNHSHRDSYRSSKGDSPRSSRPERAQIKHHIQLDASGMFVDTGVSHHSPENRSYDVGTAEADGPDSVVCRRAGGPSLAERKNLKPTAKYRKRKLESSVMDSLEFVHFDEVSSQELRSVFQLSGVRRSIRNLQYADVLMQPEALEISKKYLEVRGCDKV